MVSSLYAFVGGAGMVSALYEPSSNELAVMQMCREVPVENSFLSDAFPFAAF